jgi:hypothetical protein
LASKKKSDDKKTKQPQKKGTIKAKAVKTSGKKKAAPKKKKLSLKDLIFKKFDMEIPGELHKVEPPGTERYTAPPLISTADEKEAERLKKLLFKKFEIPPSKKKQEIPKKPSALPVTPQKKAPDYHDIMARQFLKHPDPEKLFKGPTEKEGDYSAPPIIDTDDGEKFQRLKKLLFKKFDMATPEKGNKPEAPEISKISDAEQTSEKISEKKEVSPDPSTTEKMMVPDKKKPDYKEIMSRKFLVYQPPGVTAEDMDEFKKNNYTAPPIIDTDDVEEARRLKALFFRKFHIPRSPIVPEHPVTQEASEKTKGLAPPTGELEEKISEKPVEGIEPEKETELKQPVFAEKKIKTEQEGPKVSVSYDEPYPTDTEVSEPMDKTIKYGIAVFVLIILMIIGYSFANVNNYYIRENPNGIEIWKGKFSPMGAEQLVFIPGAKPPETPKDTYSAEEVLPLAFSYQIEKADSLMDAQAIPEVTEVRSRLEKALSFATTQEEKAAVESRLNTLKGLTIQYRANVRASKGSAEDLVAAANLLKEALKLDLYPLEKETIQTKIDNLQKRAEQMNAQETKAKELEAAESMKSSEKTPETPTDESSVAPPATESAEH